MKLTEFGPKSIKGNLDAVVLNLDRNLEIKTAEHG